MSKYIKTIPLTQIERIAIVTNRGPVSKWLTLEQAMRAQAVEPDIGINGGYYNGDGTPAARYWRPRTGTTGATAGMRGRTFKCFWCLRAARRTAATT